MGTPKHSKFREKISFCHLYFRSITNLQIFEPFHLQKPEYATDKFVQNVM